MNESIDLTVRDLGVKVETYTHEYRMYAVDGLPNGVQARVIEQHGEFTAHLVGVAVAAGSSARSFSSLAAALDELRSLWLIAERSRT